jgi:endogenous inhibitor of DNA gyrase (YacG/DUF329 family)
MSNWLVPCPSCARHVNANTQCPFCGTHVAAAEAPTTLNARLHRAAMIGLGAAVALSAACSPNVAPAYGAPADTSVQTDSASQDTGGPAPAYGAPASDAGTD